MIVPDKRNMRRNTVQVQRYRQSIIKFGNIQGALGSFGSREVVGS